MSKPTPYLSPRTIKRYNRLAHQVGALTFTAKDHKGNTPASAAITQVLNAIHAEARRVYAREPDKPAFAPLPPDAALTALDLRLLVHQLSAAGMAFEERYHHLTEEGQAALNAPPRDDDDW